MSLSNTNRQCDILTMISPHRDVDRANLAKSKERDFLREKERQARQNMVDVESEILPIFDAPFRVEPTAEDDVRRRIRKTLGDFNQVKEMLNSKSNLIGLTCGLMGSAPQKVRIDGNREGSNSTKGKVINGQHPNPAHGERTSNSGAWPTAQQPVAYSREKQWHTDSRKVVSKDKNKPTHKHSRHPPPDLTRDSHRDLHKSSSRERSLERPQSLGAPTAEKITSIPTARIKPFQVDSNNSSGGLPGSITTTVSNSPANSKILNGLVMNGETKGSKLSNKHNLSKICIIEESKVSHESQCDLENILKEMKCIAPPLTGIHTPRKDEHPKFPFTANLKDGQGLLSHGKESQLCDSPPHLIQEKNLRQSPCIKDDLALSDDSEDEKARESTQNQGKKWSDNENVAHSSSSDSSSSDSEDSSSDSDSSSSHVSSPPQLPKQNWSLQTFVNKIQEKSNSPAAPVTLGPQDSTHLSGTGVSEKSSSQLDQSNDLICHDFIFDQVPSPKMGLSDDSNSCCDLKNVNNFKSDSVSSCELGKNGKLKIKLTKTTTESETSIMHPTTGNKSNSTRLNSAAKWLSKKSSSEEHLDELEPTSPIALSLSKNESLPSKSPNRQSNKSSSKSLPKSERKASIDHHTKKVVAVNSNANMPSSRNKSKFIDSLGSSDEDVIVDVVGMNSPCKLDNESQSSRSASKHELKKEPKCDNSNKAKASPHKFKLKDRHKGDKDNKNKDCKNKENKTKDNKIKELKNSSGVSDILKMIGGSSQEFITKQEPLLSPIPNHDIIQQKISPLTYNKDGAPQLLVRLNLSLINRIPTMFSSQKKTFTPITTKSLHSVPAPPPPKLCKMQPPTTKVKTEDKLSSQSVDKSSSQIVDKPSSQSVNKSSSQSVNKSSSQSVNKSGSQSVNKSGSQSVNKSGSQNVNKSGSQNVNKSSSQNVNKSSSQSTNKLGSQSADKSSSQSVDKLSSQSVDKSSSQNVDKLSSQSVDKLSSQNVDKSSSQNADKSSSQSADKLSSQSADKTNSQSEDKSSSQSTVKSNSQNAVKSNSQNGVKSSSQNTVKPSSQNAVKLSSQNVDKNRSLKRKSDTEHKEEKKIKMAKTSSKQSANTVEQKEVTSREDDRSWDRKHPPRLTEPPPVLTPVSISNKHATNSFSGNKRSKEGEKESKKKKTLHQDNKSDNCSRSADRSSSTESKKANRGDNIHQSNHTANNIQPIQRTTPQQCSTPQPERRSHNEKQKTTAEMDEGHFKADVYLQEARRMKHEADNESNITAKVRKYLDAVLYFILTGIAMEQDKHTDDTKAFTMFKDTLNLITHISSKFQKQHCKSENGYKGSKLAVLSLRCQSILYLKLFNMKRDELVECHKMINEYNKLSVSKPSLTASPYQTCWNKTTSTPLSVSPSPSPAGSVGSVGSQGSGNSEATGNASIKVHAGNSVHVSSPSSICVPQRIYTSLQNHMSFLNYLMLCHDLWEQADQLTLQDSKEFFDNLATQSGQLTVHSSLLQLIQYVRQGLNSLKDT